MNYVFAAMNFTSLAVMVLLLGAFWLALIAAAFVLCRHVYQRSRRRP